MNLELSQFLLLKLNRHIQKSFNLCFLTLKMGIIPLITKCAQHKFMPFPPPNSPFVPGMDLVLTFNS